MPDYTLRCISYGAPSGTDLIRYRTHSVLQQALIMCVCVCVCVCVCGTDTLSAALTVTRKTDRPTERERESDRRMIKQTQMTHFNIKWKSPRRKGMLC